MVEVRPEPMRVRHIIAWTGCDEQLILPFGIIRKSLACLMMIIREPTLQPTCYVRICSLPSAEGRQWHEMGKRELLGDLLEQEICQRRGRLSDCKSRMRSSVQQNNRKPAPSAEHRHYRPR